MATTDFIAAIELSSSKIAGIAGKKNSDGSIQVLAFAHEEASSFVRKGGIYNIDKAAQALNNIVDKLKGQLGSTPAKVYVGISGQSLHAVKNYVESTVNDEGRVSSELVDRLCDENRQAVPAEMHILDVVPQEYKIDNILYVDPIGVTGQTITGEFLNIVARTVLKKNLEDSFAQVEVEIADDPIVAPLALSNAILTIDEMRAGCALVDFGADTTTVAVYKNNILRHLCVLPLGGNNITRDIASLQMEEHEAEQLKQQYGNAICEEEEGGNPTTCLMENGRTINLADINNLVEARTEEILANAWNMIQSSGYADKLLAGIVFTGGASNLKNLEEAFKKLSKVEKIRTAKFVRETVYGFGEFLKDGSYNTLLGLLMAGKENCCKPEAEKQIIEEPGDIFKDDEELERLKEENRLKKLEEEKRRKEEERRRKEDDKRKKEEEKKKKPNRFISIFEKITENFLEDE